MLSQPIFLLAGIGAALLALSLIAAYAAKILFRSSLVAGFYFAGFTALFLLLTRERPYLFLPSDLYGWWRYSNLFQNTYLLWRFDPLIRLAEYLFSPSPEVRFICLMALSWYGTYRLMKVLRSEGSGPAKGPQQKPHHDLLSSSPLTISSFIATIPLSILAVDGIALSAFAWIPLIAALVREEAAEIIRLLRRKGRRKGKRQSLLSELKRLFPIVGLSVFAAQGANHFALISAGIVLLLAWIPGNSEIPRGLAHCDTRSTLRIAAAIIVPAIFVLLTIPSAPFPEYPQMAHLVPDDGIAGIIRPLVGVDYPLAVINTEACRTVYGKLVVLLAALAVWGLVCSRQIVVLRYNPFLLLGGSLFILVALDTLLPVAWSYLAPLAALSRLSPWGTTIYLPSLLLGVGAWCCAIGFFDVAIPSLRVAELFAFGVLTLSSYVFSDCKEVTPSIVATDARIVSPSAHVVRHLLRSIPAAASASNSTITDQVIRGAFDDPNGGEPRSLHELRARVDLFLAQSSGALGAPLASHDLSRQRRFPTWSWRRGYQCGDEVVRITLPNAIELDGIDISAGRFESDFPRGVLLSTGPCDQDDTRTVVRHFASWQGSIERTPDGYPFFSGQERVRIDLPERPVARCIYVQQTATASYDWTIADITILTQPHHSAEAHSPSDTQNEAEERAQ